MYSALVLGPWSFLDITFRVNVAKPRCLPTNCSLSEFIPLSRVIPGKATNRAGPDLCYTRAGGTDDGSQHKLPQVNDRDSFFCCTSAKRLTFLLLLMELRTYLESHELGYGQCSKRSYKRLGKSTDLLKAGFQVVFKTFV